jgi:hypothetical protein
LAGGSGAEGQHAGHIRDRLIRLLSEECNDAEAGEVCESPAGSPQGGAQFRPVRRGFSHPHTLQSVRGGGKRTSRDPGRTGLGVLGCGLED